MATLKRPSFLLLALACISPAFADDPVEIPDNTAAIKVLIDKSTTGALVEAKCPYRLISTASGKEIGSGGEDTRYFLHNLDDGMKWKSLYKNVFQLRFEPREKHGSFLVNGTEYDGSLEVHRSDDISYIVNNAPIETYVKARVSQRFAEKNLHTEALQAIAIVERTKAYYLAGKNSECNWHIDATLDDEYPGFVMTQFDPEVDHAVDATRHLIMTYKGGAFPAEMTENSAGRTANYKAVYRKKVSAPEGVEAPTAQRDRARSMWAFKMHKDELAHIAKLSHLSGIDLYLDNSSNRVYGLRVKQDKRARDLSFFDLQRRVGSDKLKSNDFSIKIEDNTVVFEGYGAGAGAGLCLYSAEIMGRSGSSFAQILYDFFPHTHLTEMKSLSEFNLTTARHNN